MTWHGFFRVSRNVLRFTGILILQLLLFLLNVTFTIIKFTFMFTMLVLTIGKIGTDSMGLGSKR